MKLAKHQSSFPATSSTPTVLAEVNAIQYSQSLGNKHKGKGKSKKYGNLKESPKTMNPENESKLKQKYKFPCLLCGDDHFTKEYPRHEEIKKFLKNNLSLAILTNPFPCQQQLIDHTSLHGASSSMEEIKMMSIEICGMTT